MSGSMSATTIVQSSDRSSDDPPSLGSECEVCGPVVRPDDLIEDRGRLTCRACMKKSGSIAGASASAGLRVAHGAEGRHGDLRLRRRRQRGPRRGKMFTFGPPSSTGAFAAILVIACNVYLSVFPKPVGSKTVAVKEDTPAPSTDSKWDTENRPVIERMMSEASAMKADQNRLPEAKAKYDAVVAMAKGQAIGAQDVRAPRWILRSRSRRRCAVCGERDAADRDATAAPSPGWRSRRRRRPRRRIEVPDSIAPKEGSVFDDVEVAIPTS
jgi:hypothetical protein